MTIDFWLRGALLLSLTALVLLAALLGLGFEELSTSWLWVLGLVLCAPLIVMPLHLWLTADTPAAVKAEWWRALRRVAKRPAVIGLYLTDGAARRKGPGRSERTGFVR